MNIAVTPPADASVGAVVVPLESLIPPDDDDTYDPAAACMKIMMGIETVGMLAREKTDSRDHIELMCEDLLLPTISRLYEQLKGLRT